MFAPNSKKREYLSNCLLKKMNELGRRPTYDEVKADENMPEPNDYAYYFRSFSEAVDEVWKGYNLKKQKTSITIKKPIKIIKPG